MDLIINGQVRRLEELGENSTVGDLVALLGLKADRVAIERNGNIVSRTTWAETPLSGGDRLELVHFVGGGRRQSSSSE